ncbi:hypothetical protein EAE99_006459 [Botrytis elliptica]|nr:hypothetical protein EAE99_006459 [Botrytis elliptica]
MKSSYTGREDKGSTREQPHHGGEDRDDGNDGMAEGSEPMSDGDEPRESSSYAGSVGGGERPSGSTRTSKERSAWVKKSENPSRSEKGSKVVVGYTRKRVGSSTLKNDARDDNRSRMGIEIGSRRSDGGSRRGGKGDVGRNSRTILELWNGETSSQQGKDGKKHSESIGDSGRDDKSRKRGDRKGSSNNGEKDNDEITPVSNRHDDGRHNEKGDGEKVSFSSANKNHAQTHEGIPEDPNDLGDCITQKIIKKNLERETKKSGPDGKI